MTSAAPESTAAGPCGGFQDDNDGEALCTVCEFLVEAVALEAVDRRICRLLPTGRVAPPALEARPA